MKQKIYQSFPEFKKVLDNLKINKKKIILCHGVFDLLHAGHLNYFNEAKKKGEILIVGITADKYVIKAPGRPLFKFNQRAAMVGALEIVDYVIKSDFVSAINIINFLKPNIYFKGSDYKVLNNDVTGNIKKEKDAVELNGGIIQYSSGETFSSSAVLNTIDDTSSEKKKFLSTFKKKYNFDFIDEVIFKKIKKDKVLVFGELILDKYIFTKNLGRSGKESILTLEKTGENKYPGGSFAISNHVSNLVKNVSIFFISPDKCKKVDFCKSRLRQNIKLRKIVKKNYQTITKIKIIDLSSNSKVLGIYEFKDEELNKSFYNKLRKILKKEIKKYDTILVSDYGHSMIDKKTAYEISKISSKNIIVNTQLNAANFGYHTIGKYKNCSCAIINELELRHEMRSRHVDVKILIKKMSKNLNIKYLIVTAGNKGSFGYDSKRKLLFYCPSFAENIVDKIGAGDCYMAIFGIVWRHCKGDLSLAMFIASLATTETLSSYGNENFVNLVNLKKRLLYTLK